jgi:hypothetical protein
MAVQQHCPSEWVTPSKLGYIQFWSVHTGNIVKRNPVPDKIRPVFIANCVSSQYWGGKRGLSWGKRSLSWGKRSLSLSKAVDFDRTFGELSRAAQPTPPRFIEKIANCHLRELPIYQWRYITRPAIATVMTPNCHL